MKTIKRIYIFDKDTLQSHRPEDYTLDPDSDEILSLLSRLESAKSPQEAKIINNKLEIIELQLLGRLGYTRIKSQK